MAENRKVKMNGDEGSPVEAPKKKTINILLTKDSLSMKGKDGKVDLQKFKNNK